MYEKYTKKDRKVISIPIFRPNLSLKTLKRTARRWKRNKTTREASISKEKETVMSDDEHVIAEGRPR